MSTGGLYRSGRVVEARQVTSVEAAVEIAAWCGGAVRVQVVTVRFRGNTATVGDWILKGENGEFEVWGPIDFDVEFSPVPAVES